MLESLANSPRAAGRVHGSPQDTPNAISAAGREQKAQRQGRQVLEGQAEAEWRRHQGRLFFSSHGQQGGRAAAALAAPAAWLLLLCQLRLRALTAQINQMKGERRGKDRAQPDFALPRACSLPAALQPSCGRDANQQGRSGQGLQPPRLISPAGQRRNTRAKPVSTTHLSLSLP